MSLLGILGHPFPEAHSLVIKIENSAAKSYHRLVALCQNTLKLRNENTTIARAIYWKHEELMVVLKILCAEFGSRLQV